MEHVVVQRPVILFVDGRSSHLTLELIDLARSNDIILFCLPPHTTHALQPLDVAVFKSLKGSFFKTVRAFCFTRKNFVVSKRDFVSVVKGPFEKAFSISNIKAGFSKSGIFPFNPKVVDVAKMKPSEVYRSSTALPSSSESAQSSRSSSACPPSSSENSSATSSADNSTILVPSTPSPVVSTLNSSATLGNTSPVRSTSAAFSPPLSAQLLNHSSLMQLLLFYLFLLLLR